MQLKTFYLYLHLISDDGGFGKSRFDQPGGGFLNTTISSPSTSEKKKVGILLIIRNMLFIYYLTMLKLYKCILERKIL